MDDEPLVSIAGATVVEGNTGTKSLTFTVTLSAASDAPVTVTYATADGSATIAGGDYQAATGTLTFAPGQTSKTITVLVNGDRLARIRRVLHRQPHRRDRRAHRQRHGLRDDPGRRAAHQHQQRTASRRATAAPR